MTHTGKCTFALLEDFLVVHVHECHVHGVVGIVDPILYHHMACPFVGCLAAFLPAFFVCLDSTAFAISVFLEGQKSRLIGFLLRLVLTRRLRFI